MIKIFNDDECQYLNKICERKTNAQLSKKDVISCILLAKDVADTDDEQIVELIDGLYAKLCSMSDVEWDTLRKEIPFQVNITAEQNVDEVPEE